MKIANDAGPISSRERFLEAIVQSAIDYAIISMDLDGLVTSWNEGAFNILGWKAEDMIGKPATIFFTQEDRESGIPQKEMTAALNRGRGSDERWHLRADGTMFWASGEMMALYASDEQIIGFIKILRDRTQERERAERERLLMHELGHRMKNTLSVVQAIVTQSLRNAVSLDDAAEKLQLRIAAYAKAHDILLQKDWVSATLADVVEATKMNIGLDGSTRILSSGPDIQLGPQAALSFSMVFHELLTNASKYGALSNAQGRVEVKWNVERRDDVETLVACWREIDGPPIPSAEPDRKGFGSRLIVSSLQAFGEANISYRPEGLTLLAELPLSKIQVQNDLSAIDKSSP
ncbi:MULTISPECIES: HWE histidine kinase domain-containing protein [unclassified Rhizobium]|uniref:sensor histidine kinase n=1 Tax=unclassified Rhizobium TaxID=2613769 RepID=UPI0006F7741C|nr:MULTISPECIES: HWE histidine kinase domain-containing protein [unclassified Rhizobium]KQV38050.1 regulator [Rhizobium sp. Root1212]KRD30707.1 regulator [Rhizobium sp. Root268]